ncbi:SMP-30/gluconolactonase/LRE family protein [Actinokineospora sp. HUAS TT18]|uniref:SMP-30/gluconolactonase/LRE family protein n=1 Tax=Actinokineospora sp. HUAS TT18 TaxID=3447451 RepID=UPI003F52602C
MIKLSATRGFVPPGQLSEGPVWDRAHQELLWVDIPAGHIHSATIGPDLVHRATVTLDRPVGAVLPCVSGGLLAAAGDAFVFLDRDGTVTETVPLPGPQDGLRFNDAKVDPRGRLLAGTMSYAEETGSAALYRLDPDRTVTTLRADVTISNGLGWSPDGGTLYYADSPTQRVTAYDYDLDTGTISGARTFAAFDDGVPDGLCVDRDGTVWVAVWGTGQVRAFDPTGRAAAVVNVGPSQVSSCAFAGPDLDVLVITTAAQGPAASEPNAGRLFTCVPGATGLPVTPFADTRLVIAGD